MCARVSRAIIAGLVLLACFLGRAGAQQDDPAAQMQTLIEAGDAGYLRGDYEAGRQAFEKAWQLVLETAPDNPVRYDILKRLADIRAARSSSWQLHGGRARRSRRLRRPARLQRRRLPRRGVRCSRRLGGAHRDPRRYLP